MRLWFVFDLFSIPFEGTLRTAVIFIFVFTLMKFKSVIGIFTLFYVLFSENYWITLVYLIWYYIDSSACQTGGRSFTFMRNLTFWRKLSNSFPMNLVKTQQLTGNKNYLMGIHPKNTISFSTFNLSTNASDFAKLYPTLKQPHFHTLNCQYYPPLWRELFMFIGGCSASEKTLHYVLNEPEKGQVSALFIGGHKNSSSYSQGNL
jgi:hypothetical protein